MAQYRELQEVPFDEDHSGGNKLGYKPVPTQEYPQPPPPYRTAYDTHPFPGSRAPSYPPAQASPSPVVQQQQTSNVVVVGNQPAQQRVSVVHFEQVNDHLFATVSLFLLCLFLGNLPVMLCLFPALIFSCMASTYKDAGEIELAKRFGALACKCSIAALVPAIVTLLVGVAVSVVFILMIVGFIAV